MKLFGLILLITTTLQAATLENFKGHITLWTRPLCLEAVNCPLPKPLGAQWTVEIQLTKPAQSGTSTMKSVTLKKDLWTAQITLFWIQPKDNQKDYIVSQTKLTHSQHGFVFECSRYDFLENIKGFPTGSCSGRMGNEQIGLAFQKLKQIVLLNP